MSKAKSHFINSRILDVSRHTFYAVFRHFRVFFISGIAQLSDAYLYRSFRVSSFIDGSAILIIYSRGRFDIFDIHEILKGRHFRRHFGISEAFLLR